LKTFFKIVAGVCVGGILLAAGCAAVVGFGANQAAKSISHAEASDTAASKVFAHKFAHVKTGDTITGAGGMSFAQVRHLLGAPKASDVTSTQSNGYKLVTWSYSFLLAKGSAIYSVDFANGHVSGKSRM
jgi:hypothetical protein